MVNLKGINGVTGGLGKEIAANILCLHLQVSHQQSGFFLHFQEVPGGWGGKGLSGSPDGRNGTRRI